MKWTKIAHRHIDSILHNIISSYTQVCKLLKREENFSPRNLSHSLMYDKNSVIRSKYSSWGCNEWQFHSTNSKHTYTHIYDWGRAKKNGQYVERKWRKMIAFTTQITNLVNTHTQSFLNFFIVTKITIIITFFRQQIFLCNTKESFYFLLIFCCCSRIKNLCK
jgi:hypothetical protein